MPCADTDDDVAGTAVGATIWVGGGGVIMLLLGIAAAAAPSLLLAAAAATASPSWTRASWSFNGLDISAKEEKKKTCHEGVATRPSSPRWMRHSGRIWPWSSSCCISSSSSITIYNPSRRRRSSMMMR